MRHHRQGILIDAHNLICVPSAEYYIFKSARQPLLSAAPSSVRTTIDCEPPVARDGMFTRSPRPTIAAVVLPWSCVCPNSVEIKRNARLGMLTLGLFLVAGSKAFRFLVNWRWSGAIADVATIALVPKLRCQPSPLGSPWPSHQHLP
jgi:hypothetical protein